MRQTLRESLRIARERHALKGLLVLASIAAVALFGGGYLLASQASDSKVTTLALCALKQDLERRVQASTNYLADNPNGAPGIPVKVIRDGIANQQRTINALRILKC